MKSLKDYILNEGFKLGKNKVKKEEDFVDLELPSKTLWCKYNVGATCRSDAKSWYGDYFMWGDNDSKNNKTCNWENYKWCNCDYDKLIKYCPADKTNYWGGNGKPDNKLVLDEEDDMVNTNMNGDWKMPTKEQCKELLDNTTNKWVEDYNDIQGLNGRLLTSKTNDNTLFIPAAGYQSSNSVFRIGIVIGIWSSTLSIINPYAAYYLLSDNEYISIGSSYRNRGIPVRGVMN